MRYSPFKATENQNAEASSASNRAFFEAVAHEAGFAALHGAVLLVGARDPRALALRRAQAALRFDQRPSYWSHAALIVRWDEDPARTKGVEVTLDPRRAHEQVPERNGVTTFSLQRYLDERRYPNVGLLVIGFEDAKPEPDAELTDPERTVLTSAERTLPTPAERRAAAISAALSPLRGRDRYPLWDLLGAWARYSYLPFTTPNPLLEGMPMPSAALCEYAYEAAGLDLTPGAAGHNNCPEMLYATAKHWAAGLSPMQAEVRRFTLVRHRHAIAQRELPPELGLRAPSIEELG